MIIITSPLMHKGIVEHIEKNDDRVVFEKKEGINLYFKNTSNTTDDVLANEIKALIKTNPMFASLLIKVNTKEYI